MAFRVSTNKILSNNNNNSTSGQRVSFKDIMLDLKVTPSRPEITYKLKLVGEPVGYLEYSAKKRDYNNLDDQGKPTETEVEFPDKEFNGSYTRIGADDITQCEWAKLGYVATKKYAQNVIVRKPDGTFEIKILNKGATVFKPMALWETGRAQENLENGTNLSTCLGARVSPEVKLKAVYKDKAPGKVEYTVTFMSADTTITDEEIAALKAIYTPSPEVIEQERESYELRRKDNPEMPPFEDWFICGHNLMAIYKHTPLRTEAKTYNNGQNNSTGTFHAQPSASKPASVAVVVDEEEDDLTLPSAEKVTASASKIPTTPIFEGLDDEDDDWTGI